MKTRSPLPRTFLVALVSVLFLLARHCPERAGPADGADGGMQQTPTINVKKFNADKELTRLSKRYKLTEAQKSKTKPILQDQEKQIHDLGEDESLSDRRVGSHR